MNKLIARSVAVAVMLVVFSMPVTLSATANAEDQPHMQAALEALRQAEQHLKEAAHDKGGHREAALKATQEAIKHVEMGIPRYVWHEYMQMKPIANIAAVSKALKLSIPTVTVALNHLVQIGIVEEVTGKRRDRIFTYFHYFNIVSEGTEPLPR